jgi:DNA-binding MarR family transcriptional regulator
LKSQIPDDFEPPRSAHHQSCSLPILLSKILLSFAIEFEIVADFSLAVYANILRIAAERNVRVKDIPQLSGVSKEATAMALDRLQKRGLAEVRNESANSRFKVLIINPAGRDKAAACADLLQEIEIRWQKRFGSPEIARLRASLESLIQAESSEGTSLLMEAIIPYPDNWRAQVPPREALPHYPMVLHRGGYPDGS